MIDPALLRPGRFDKIIQVPNPIKIVENDFEINAEKIPMGDDVDMDKIAEITDGMSGADVHQLQILQFHLLFTNS